MSDNRWQRIEDIFHQATELAPGARSAFLSEVCAGDDSLRKEVESLLAHDAEDGRTFAGAAGDAGPIPQSIAHYRISSKVGEGGMGAVYRATDTKLGREVAIKVLPDAFAGDRDRMARFSREAKVLASLNHPNIAAIYGVEDRAIIMELVEGQDLRGPLPIATALNSARQIAGALDAAHEKGIVHRDLKPANIRITPDGVVKVLDFGLAAVTPASASDSDPTRSPTLTMAATQAGMIVGTAAYMSPEQASGKPVDKRADIWSFGVVLWELLTGHRLFEGETDSHTLAEVLGGPIDFGQLPRETPAAIRGLLRRCLERNVKNRLRDVGEARVAIEATLAGETPLLEGAPEPGGARRLWMAWSVAAVATVGLATVAFLYFRQKPPAPAAPVHFEIPAPENSIAFALSPDGRKLVYVAGDRMWVHWLESGESRDLTAAENWAPFWSPDSRFVAYICQGKLKRIAVTGGPPQTVLDFTGNWGAGAWNQHDEIVFGDGKLGLFRVPASGGVSVQITALDPARQETNHFGPSFLPDGRHFVYTRISNSSAKSAIYLGSVDAKPEQQSSRPLVTSTWQAAYAPSADPGTGYLLFIREGTLMSQPFDSRRLELAGHAAPVAEQIADNGGGKGGWASFSASAKDVLAFRRSAASDTQLAWYDREGKVLGTVGEPGDYRGLTLSPDGTRLAVVKGHGNARTIWLLDLSRGAAAERFTFAPVANITPVWSPDGSRIVFSSNRDGRYNLYRKQANGGKEEEVLLKSSEDKLASSWSRDGRFLLYTVLGPKTKFDIWVLPLDRDRKPVPFLSTEFSEREARFSPDGHWVAYTSDESGQDEVYVRPFTMNSAGTAVAAGGKWHISNGLGDDPRWRGDSRELYYRSRGGKLMAVEIAANLAFRAGNPQPVGLLPFWVWDSAPDGRRFLRVGAMNAPQPYTVVLNWQAGLKK